MEKSDTVPPPPPWLRQDLTIRGIELPDEDAACLVLNDLNFDAQFLSVQELLNLHKQASIKTANNICELEEQAKQARGLYSEWAVNELIDHYHESVYQDASHSMAAAGMLAPLLESVFYQAFQGVRKLRVAGRKPFSDHPRWTQPAEDQWDCHYVWTGGRRSTNLVEGILQLSDAIGLKTYLPADLDQTLKALFEYRNKMFHHGFEWPVEERTRFQARIQSANWPDNWFSKATSGDEPWIFYMTEAFVEHCLQTVRAIVTGIGAYCNHSLP